MGREGRVLLLRHGPTEWSDSGRHTGRTDIPLTGTGRAAVLTLAATVAQWKLARVLVSPLSRARETAQLLALDAEPDADLLEWDYGDYEGITSAEIQKQRAAAGLPPWSLWRDGCPRGEQADAVGQRVDRVLARIAPMLRDGGDVALVAHGHLLRVLTARWLGFPPAEGARFMLDAGRLCVLDHEHGAAAIRVWNWAPALGG